jgi:hypothetical protein
MRNRCCCKCCCHDEPEPLRVSDVKAQPKPELD